MLLRLLSVIRVLEQTVDECDGRYKYVQTVNQLVPVSGRRRLPAPARELAAWPLGIPLVGDAGGPQP